MRIQKESLPRVAAIYCRVSSEGQENNTSLGEQERLGREYAAREGYSVVKVYREVWSGFALWERPQLTVLRDSVRNGEVETIICYALDRLSRRQVHTAILTDEWERANIALHFVTETFEQTAIGEFLRSAKAFAAELEREKIVERTTRGKRARIMSGKLMPGSRPLFGYQFRDSGHTAYDPDPITAPVVQRVFSEAENGGTLYGICQTLMADGVPSPSGATRWYRRTLHVILLDGRYTGEATGLRWQVSKEPSGRRVKVARDIEQQISLPAGVIPPLVTSETFAAVQERLQRNKESASRNNPNPEASLLRGGIAKCAACGNNMRVANRTSGGKKLPLYVCNGTKTAHIGTRPSITVAHLDQFVWQRVEAFLQDPSVVRHYREQLAESSDVADEVVGIERLITDLDRKRSNLTRTLALFETEEDAVPVVAEIAQLGKRRAELVTEKAGLLARREQHVVSEETLRSIEEWCHIVRGNLSNLTYEQRRIILEELGAQVRIWERGHEPRYVMEWVPNFAIAYTTST